MKAARTRIGRIKLRGGADLRVLHGLQDTDRAYVERDVRLVLDAHCKVDSNIAGFAIVVWSPDGTSTCKSSVNDSTMIPSILVPDFVRNRLLADRIEHWTLETINGVAR